MRSKFFSKKFTSSLCCSVASAMVVTILFFVWHNCCNCLYDVCGKWEFRTNIQESTHDEFIGLSVYFDVVLSQNNSGFFGSGEKIAEKSAMGKRYEFEKINRVRIEITGSVKNNLFKDDQVIVHWVEHGRKRDTSTYLNLTVIDKDTMQGSFASTAADSTGTIYCSRKKWE